MRLESVEQIGLDIFVELSFTGQVLRWARQSNLSGGVSMRKADGWNIKNHSHLTVARHLCEKTNPIVLVVAIREGEEKEICSAVMRELLRIVKDQIREECAVAMVLRRRAIVKTVLRKRQMKHIDVEEMRVVTNDKHIAEQIKSDSTLSSRECLFHGKVENVVMNERTRSWKIGEGTKFEERRDEWSHEGKRRHGEQRRGESSQKWKIRKIGKL